jgi:PilZ domain
MRLSRTFESEEELREEHRVNLANGGLRVPATEPVPLHSKVEVDLRGPHGAEVSIEGTVVATLPDGVALMITADADDLVRRLLAKPAAAADPTQNAWDRMRSLSQMEKILLATKADRGERALLLQDNDPRVLLSVLRNPRLTVEEVARLARSPFLTYQIADVMVKTAQWMANLDVRVGLVNNAKTPPAFALRILPSLPIAEIRNVARGGTSMALKQAAIKLTQGR